MGLKGRTRVGSITGLAIFELLLVGRFSAVGIISTFIHIGTVSIIMAKSHIVPMIANLLAFVLAFTFSFLGQYHWTFKARCNKKTALRRFFLVSMTAFLVNNILLASLLRIEVLSNYLSTILAATIIPVITYTASRIWAFQS